MRVDKPMSEVRSAEPGSDAEAELVERGTDASQGRFVSHVVVLSAAQVLNERVTCRDDPSRPRSGLSPRIGRGRALSRL